MSASRPRRKERPKIKLIIVSDNSGSCEDAVLQLLSQAHTPLCVSTMAFLLGRPSRDICMTLNRLKKYGDVGVAKVTSRRMQFWAIRGRPED